MIDSWPNLPRNAERELIQRISRVGERAGLEIYSVETSDEIYRIQPDLVLATHEFTPKLTTYTTLGCMWSPPVFFDKDPIRMRNILSYDGYLVGSPIVRSFLDDVSACHPFARKPSSEFRFLPSSPIQRNLEVTRKGSRSLVYVGVHWDGLRHGALHYSLDRVKALNVYGPKGGWGFVSGSYRGEIPFDGASMFSTLARHGIALCFHKEEHRKADTPSMRLFEAAASGCVLICDEISFAKNVFGDCAFFVDTNAPAERQFSQVMGFLDEIHCRPKIADEMARQSRDIFEREWSLDVMLPRVVDFGKSLSRRTVRASPVPVSDANPDVDVIIRCGGRDLLFLKRAVESVLHQKHIKTRVLLVDYKERDDIRQLATELKGRALYVPSKRTGCRSTALWDGLRRVKATYFAMLDDDDTVAQEHWSSLRDALEKSPAHSMAYSGVLRLEEDGAYVSMVNFSGPLSRKIPETRELKFLDFYDIDRLVAFDNYIQSNAWLARTELLASISLEDPELVVAEDMYLYLLFASKGPFVSVFTQTANWHWRSRQGENSMLSVDQEVWAASVAKIERRLENVLLLNGQRFGERRRDVLNRSKEVGAASGTVVFLPGQAVIPSLGFEKQCRNGGLHPGEANGVWTSSTFGWFVGHTTEFTRKAKVTLTVRVGPDARGAGQRARIMLNGSELCDDLFKPWEERRIEAIVEFAERTNAMTFLFLVKEVASAMRLGIGIDDRPLGIMLQTIIVEPLAEESKSTKLAQTVDPREGFQALFALTRFGVGSKRLEHIQLCEEFSSDSSQLTLTRTGGLYRLRADGLNSIRDADAILIMDFAVRPNWLSGTDEYAFLDSSAENGGQRWIVGIESVDASGGCSDFYQLHLRINSQRGDCSGRTKLVFYKGKVFLEFRPGDTAPWEVVDWSRVPTQDVFGKYWRAELAGLLESDARTASASVQGVASNAAVAVLESALSGAPGLPGAVRTAIFATAVAIVGRFAVDKEPRRLEPVSV
jgi:phosphoglycerol transferase